VHEPHREAVVQGVREHGEAAAVGLYVRRAGVSAARASWVLMTTHSAGAPLVT
jgi:hypothetical protein